MEGRGSSAWSTEIAVTPDGGTKPADPRLLAVIRDRDGKFVAVRFTPVAKATGYRVRWSGPVTGERVINGAEPAVVFVPGNATGEFTVTAINANGESAASNSLELRDP